jgi:hypothetical protein
VTPTDPEPQPIFRHSMAWSLATAAFAFTLLVYAWGAAYVGSTSNLWVAGFLGASGILALSGVGYAGFLLLRRTRTVARLAFAPVAVLANLFSLSLAVATALTIRW